MTNIEYKIKLQESQGIFFVGLSASKTMYCSKEKKIV